MRRKRLHGPACPATDLDRLFRDAGFTPGQYRLADGILEGTQQWVWNLAATLGQLESAARRPPDATLRAARLDTERLAEQLGALRRVLRQSLAGDPDATVH